MQKPGTYDGLECSVHNLPKPLLREFRHVFQDEYLKQPEINVAMASANEPMVLIAIPTNQRAREDLVAIGDHIEREKDRLLNVVSIIISYFNEHFNFRNQTHLTYHTGFV